MLKALPAGRPGGTLLDRSLRNITGSIAVKRRRFTSLMREQEGCKHARTWRRKVDRLSQSFLPEIALLQTEIAMT
jgi:hypothetical protein